jgi:hypothetical protein
MAERITLQTVACAQLESFMTSAGKKSAPE